MLSDDVLSQENTSVAPILTEHSFDLITHSAEHTFRVGERLGRLLGPGNVVCLQGDLGSGKTCLTQGIGAGLRVSGIVRSPTFVLVNEHDPMDDGPRLYHVDLYRVKDYRDAQALGLEDYLYGEGVTVIEWAEHALEIMPSERLWINLAYLDYGKRSLIFDASGECHMGVLLSLKETLYGRPREKTT